MSYDDDSFAILSQEMELKYKRKTIRKNSKLKWLLFWGVLLMSSCSMAPTPGNSRYCCEQVAGDFCSSGYHVEEKINPLDGLYREMCCQDK